MGSMMVFCGLDLGTSGVKAVLFDLRGERVASAYRAYRAVDADAKRRSLDAAEIWTQVKTVLAEIACAEKPDAIAVSAFGEAVIMLDENDDPMGDVLLSTDGRGISEYEEALSKTSEEEIARICGLRVSPTYSLSKILYAMRRPGFKKCRRIMLIADYIHYMLSGEAVVDCSSASRTMLFDAGRYVWSDLLLKKFDIDKSLLSTPVLTGVLIGKIRTGLARELGLPPDMNVVSGGHDQPMCAVGVGLREESVACSMGTTECVTPIFSGMLDTGVTMRTGIPSEPIWQAGKYCALAYNHCSGLLVQWFFDMFAWQGNSKTPPYRLFEENMPKKPTRIMVQPYLVGSGTPYLDPAARLSFLGMGLDTTVFDIYKAVLEGLCLDQRLNVELLEQQGIRIGELICAGGGSRNAAWLQIKADILQKTVHVSGSTEAGALGCAIICAAALGVYASVEEAAQHMTSVKTSITPNSANKGFYTEKYEQYKTLYETLKQTDAFASAAITR